MTPMDTEAARIRAVVHEWAERVKRGEKMPRYGFDATSHWGGEWGVLRGFWVPQSKDLYIREACTPHEGRRFYWRTSIESGWVEAQKWEKGKGVESEIKA